MQSTAAPKPLATAGPAPVTARRPGLDLHHALSVQRPLVASRGRGPGAAYAQAPESFESPDAPAAPPTPPPALVALSSPPEPPAVVQRVANVDGLRDATRERLSEAPDDDLQELPAASTTTSALGFVPSC